MTIYNDYTFASTVTVDSTVAGFSLGMAKVTFGDHNPTKALIATLHGVSFIPPVGPNITLDGYWNVTTGKYDFTGTGSYKLGGLSLANAQFTMSDMTGPASFTFTAGCNFGVLTATVGGTIVASSDGGFVVTSDLTGTILDGPKITLSGTFDSAGNYDFKGKDDIAVGPLTLSQASFELSNITGLTYSDSWNYGVYSGTVSGTFTTEGYGYVVSADANGQIFGQSLELKGDIHSNGNFDLSGTANVSIGPLSLSQASFDLNNTTGFTFSDNWNFLNAFSGFVTVTIGSDSNGYDLNVMRQRCPSWARRWS